MYNQQAYAILDEMILKGNKVADMRKAELAHLETLFYELATRAEWQALETLALSAPPEPDQGDIREDGQGGQSRPQADPATIPTPGGMQAGSGQFPLGIANNDFLGNVGISSDEFLSIVDQMGDLDGYYNAMDIAR